MCVWNFLGIFLKFSRKNFFCEGPGAAGRLTLNGIRNSYKQVLRPEKWTEQVTDKGHGILEFSELSFLEKIEVGGISDVYLS